MENKRFPITPEELDIYLSRLEPTPAYNLPMLLPLGKEADFEKGKKAFLDIVAAHPYLNMQLSLDALEYHRVQDSNILVFSAKHD